MSPDLRRRSSRAVQLVTPDGRIVEAGAAVLEVARELGWSRLAAVWRTWPLRWVLEAGYWLVARNRRFTGRPA